MQTVVVLLIALAGLSVVVMLTLSVALLVQFWDTEHRVLVGWLVGGGWLAVWAIALWQLLAAVRRLARPFILTRNELSQDWQALKKRLYPWSMLPTLPRPATLSRRPRPRGSMRSSGSHPPLSSSR